MLRPMMRMRKVRKMQKHFVRFLSPGTFFAEETVKEIPSWDIELAIKMAREIVERHGAVPYGFQFQTRTREDSELDSHISDESAIYYLGGEVLTRDEVQARAREDEETLLDNMVRNNWDRVIVNTNSWRWTQPLRENDVVLEVTL